MQRVCRTSGSWAVGRDMNNMLSASSQDVLSESSEASSSEESNDEDRWDSGEWPTSARLLYNEVTPDRVVYKKYPDAELLLTDIDQSSSDYDDVGTSSVPRDDSPRSPAPTENPRKASLDPRHNSIKSLLAGFKSRPRREST